MNDYERVARVIRYLAEHHTEQPDLAVLADRAGLSPFHFHRLFSTWAGVTPKDFVQCLTLRRAKQLLRNGATILDATLEAGLSSPGRLHDLCLSLEASSPGEFKRGGAGWTIKAGFAETPFGRCIIGESPRGICHLSFVDLENDNLALGRLQAEWPAARLKRNDSFAREIAARIFASVAVRTDRPRPALRAFVRGTAFQVRVWRALLEVPAGTVITYGRLAMAIGEPSACRAVGNAVGKNPLAYVIPCHRVIRDTGAFGQYRWDPVRKRVMLGWENAPRAAMADMVSAT